mgnify:CR=1 FL=1
MGQSSQPRKKTTQLLHEAQSKFDSNKKCGVDKEQYGWDGQ